MKLNLGCGTDKREGFINIDVSPDVNADVVLDLSTKPFPYTDNSVEQILAIDFFEHILYPIPLLNECHRVLQKDGEIYIEVPMAGTNDFYKDPTHVRPFVPETFKYFADYAEGYPAIGCKPWRIKELSYKYNRIYVTMTPKK